MKSIKKVLKNVNTYKRSISSIPAHSSFVLGNVIDTDLLKLVEEISSKLSVVDLSQDSLNRMIASKRSLDLTMKELVSMQIKPDDEMRKTITELDENIKKQATDLAKKRFESRAEIDKLWGDAMAVASSVESPLDYNKSQLKTLPISFDSLKLDAQYFSFDENSQSAESFVSSVKTYVTAGASFLGTDTAAKAGASAQKQVASQLEKHKLEGTLIISAGCTHKDAKVWAPFILDVDKAINVWNQVYKEDRFDPDGGVGEFMNVAKEAKESQNALQLLSGVTYGSSFVGMVHVLKTESTKSNQQMESIATTAQAQMKWGNWFAKYSGGFGVDTSFSNDVKRMLSSQEIQSHISLISMGVIPSIKSNPWKIGVKQFSEFDPAKMMEKLGTLAASTTSELSSMEDTAKNARTGGEMLAIRGAEIKNVMTGLTELADGENKMLDINSLMTAFEDYVDKALGGGVGVPINYYLKPITKKQLAKAWVNKYYPGKFETASGGDDSEKKEPTK